jgi:ribosome recycling factor
MVSAPEPRMLVLQPFDKSLSVAIEKAIRDANLGLNPQTQGALIRVPLPMLSEERRKELVKICGKLVEEGRVAVRSARTDAMGKIKKADKVPEDEKTRAEKDVQKATDEATKQIDEQLKAKEAEILAV